MFETVEIKDVKRELGQLVRALRKQRSLSQTQLAEKLNVSRTTVQNLELGRNANIDTLLKVLKEMDLLDQLYGEITETKDQVNYSKSLY